MEPQAVFLNDLITLVNQFGLFSSVKIGQLPVMPGISVEINSGHISDLYYDRSAIHELPLLWLCKHPDQLTAYNTLLTTGNRLSSLPSYPDGEAYRWLGLEVTNEAEFVTKQEDGQYIYSMIAVAKIYF